MNQQKDKHDKESRFLKTLKSYMEANGHTYEDVHDDYNTGVDVIIDGKKYDVKASNPNKRLTIFKRYKGSWYSPLLLHQDVDYLYAIEYEDRWVVCHITKENILSHLCGEMTTYDGDGNLNICCTLSNILDISEREYIIQKPNVNLSS